MGDDRQIRHTVAELRRFEDIAERTGRAAGLRRAADLAGELAGRDPAVARYVKVLLAEAEAVLRYDGDEDTTRSG